MNRFNRRLAAEAATRRSKNMPRQFLKVDSDAGSDEHVVQLGPALKAAQAKAVRLLTESAKPPVSPPQPPETKLTPKQGKRVVGQGSKENFRMAATKELLSSLGQELRDGQDIRVNISWIIEEDGTE